MKNLDFNEFLQSTNGLKPVVVDESVFENIYQNALSSNPKESYLIPRLIKYVAAALVLLVAINLFSIIKYTSSQNSTVQTETPSKQLADDFDFNR